MHFVTHHLTWFFQIILGKGTPTPPVDELAMLYGDGDIMTFGDGDTMDYGG